jgi:hypothetical protein
LPKVTVRGILVGHGAGYITAQFKSRFLLTTSYVLEEKVGFIGSPGFAEIVILTNTIAQYSLNKSVPKRFIEEQNQLLNQ